MAKKNSNYNKQRKGNRYEKAAYEKAVKDYKGKDSFDYPRGTCGASTKGAEYDSVHTNDISWWNKISEMYSEATKVPFSMITGEQTDNLIPGSGFKLAYNSFPGIMKMEFAPGFGKMLTMNDPANRLLTNMMSDIASKTSGSLQISQGALSHFILSMDSICITIGMIKRAMEVFNVWMVRNEYYPRHLLESMGIDFQDLRKNITDYRVRFNSDIINFNHLAAPNFIDLFMRHYSMAHSLYIDDATSLAQIEYFHPRYYYKYNFNSNSLDGAEYFTYDHSGIDVKIQPLSKYIDILEAQIAAWTNTSDLGLIKGAINRAYPDRDLLTFPLVTEFDIQVPVTDTAIAWQIHNMTWMPINVTTLAVTEDVPGGYSIFSPSVEMDETSKSYYNALFKSQYLPLNSFDGDISPEFQMEATRLMNTFNTVGEFDVLGTEIITDVMIYYLKYDASGSPQLLQKRVPMFLSQMEDSAEYVGDIGAITLLTKFRNHPRVYIVTSMEDGSIACDGFIGDVYQYTQISKQQLRMLNDAAQYSAFGVLPAINVDNSKSN